MKNILILGAGFVSRPGVRYLLDSSNLNISVADIFPERAEELVEGYKNGKALTLDINNTEKLNSMIKENDIIVSLLPWTLHLKVADLCIKNNKHMATTSYVSDGMKALDPVVREKGLLFINETGVDPGIDHMSAKKIIDEVEQ
ncbi:MAG: saccharopine dehydrogenase NADP-binding domain-containing protein, partial [Candidatus Aminicenantes bacterium]|nr:saccharopine dehydrogenase NADP-binding domain-containing protein [Candidatus Aminicenantes bacterium]